MRIRRNRDNKIKIPWYVRHVHRPPVEGVDFTPADFGFRFPAVRVRPQGVRVAEPVTEPATQPVTQPATDPVRVPDPTMQPVPVPDVPGIPVPDAPPFPVPIPGRVPGRLPQPDAQNPYQQPVPQAPWLLPQFQSGYDWEAHFRRLAEQYAQTGQGQAKAEPETSTSENRFLKAVKTIMKPELHLAIGREIINQYVEAKITDLIYSKMLDDPILGPVLREAEKANMDVEKLANYFANYDWEHFDLEEMARDLTMILGAAGAARIIIFFIGRRVLFRI